MRSLTAVNASLEHVVLTSGFQPALVEALQMHWRITDLPLQREALAFVRQLTELPACVVIGNASKRSSENESSDLSAWQMLEELRRLSTELPVIISTKITTPQVIIQLGQAGAFDFVPEPAKHASAQQMALHEQALRLAIERAVQISRVRRENARLRNVLAEESAGGSGSIVVRSPSMRAVMEMAEKVAATPATVLITGESGTGKELLARYIHQRSRAAEEGFTPVNCGALSESLLAAELFGNARGAFTGADRDRIGLLRQAGTGTLFLDEIATVGHSFQVMLLRVLEERKSRPVGGTGEYPVNCRFIAAANCDLEQMVRQGMFREDLWYRLNVFHIHLPPLRQRRQEIPMLAQRFLDQISRQYGREANGFEPSAMEQLELYDWPGNVRQLRNAVERALIVTDGRRISLADLGPLRSSPSFTESVGTRLASAPQTPVTASPDHMADGLNLDYRAVLEQCERGLINTALERSHGNLTAAAQHLGLKRTTLHYRLRRLGMHWQLPLPARSPG